MLQWIGIARFLGRTRHEQIIEQIDSDTSQLAIVPDTGCVRMFISVSGQDNGYLQARSPILYTIWPFDVVLESFNGRLRLELLSARTLCSDQRVVRYTRRLSYLPGPQLQPNNFDSSTGTKIQHTYLNTFNLEVVFSDSVIGRRSLFPGLRSVGRCYRPAFFGLCWCFCVYLKSA